MSIFKTSLFAAGIIGLSLAAAGCSSSNATGSHQNAKTLTVVFLPGDSAKEAGPARTALANEIHKATGKKLKLKPLPTTTLLSRLFHLVKPKLR